MKIGLRLRLALSFVLVVLVTASLSVLLGYRLIFDNIIGQAYSTILGQLNTTQHIYDDRVQVIRLFMDHLAGLDYIKDAIVARDRNQLIRKLTETRTELSLDILNLTDAQGVVLVRARNPALYGDRLQDDLFVRKVIQEHRGFSGSDVIGREALLSEGRDLAEQALINIVETPLARVTDKSTEERGLVLKAASPILHRGQLIGVIYGAKLLNNNFDFVDRIKSLVFQDEQYQGRDVGSATLFLDDVRISTNVKRADKTRAVGTLVSEEVYNLVVEQGKTWLDKAFVVDRWYISAYKPILDVEDRVIGILYVGILEDKFDELKFNTAVSYVLIIFLSGLIGVLFSLYFIRRIVAPYRALTEASQEIAQGDYSRKIDWRVDDEVGSLARAFNKMVDAVRERDEALKEQTQKQIGQSEKLASLGRLASGIAHEINNPLTGILTYAGMLLEDFKGTEFEEDIQTIIDETLRCRKIVRGVLDFARETRLEKEYANLNQVLDNTLSLLERHVHFHNVRIVRRFDPEVPDQMLDLNQMKSVINNLAVNAADAMPQGGALTASTAFNPERKTITMEFRDTGVGIPKENLPKIFDPFFTTKDPGKGTGLGMAVTYSIVRRHGGSVDVESEVGVGTRVLIQLPLETAGNGPA
jgi:two-component system, NtrC family, sensor kinase